MMNTALVACFTALTIYVILVLGGLAVYEAVIISVLYGIGASLLMMLGKDCDDHPQ